jgi:hypothetical protein
MFCPNCSQEQISNEVKYCSRCGFLLSDVAEALQRGGRVERNVVQSAKEIKKDAMKGIAIMTFSALFGLLSLIFGTPEPSYIVQVNLLAVMLVFFSAVAYVAYVFWLKPSKLIKKDSSANDLTNFIEAKSAKRLLDEADFSQDVSYAAPRNKFATTDLVEAPTITEETTKNLRFEGK